MAKHILVPTEGSPLSQRALEVALEDYPEGSITVLHVMDPIGSGMSLIDVMRPKLKDGAPPGSVTTEHWQQWRDDAQAQAEEVFADSREIANEQDRSIKTVLEFGDPSDVIVEYAEDYEVNRIVLGSNCRAGAERFLLGSVAEAVVRRGPVPVMVVK